MTKLLRKDMLTRKKILKYEIRSQALILTSVHFVQIVSFIVDNDQLAIHNDDDDDEI